jgi:hypothetical protein
MEPGHFRCTADLPPGQSMRGAVRVGEHSLPFGPILAGANLEWSAPPGRIAALRALSRTSKGVERIDLGKAWETPNRAVWRTLRSELLAAALLAFLIDALATRLAWQRQRAPSRA